MVSSGAVSSDLSTLKSFFQSYDSEISGLSSNWTGSSYESVKNQTSSLTSKYSSILSNEMEAFMAACEDYQKYENIKSQIRSLQSVTNSKEGEKNQNSISSLQSELELLKTKIEANLSAARSVVLDGATVTTSSISTDSGSKTMQGSQFINDTFVSSTGDKIPYYVYVPDYGDNSSGLAVNLYLHGTGECDNVLKRGLPEALSKSETQPSGIVICPQTSSEQLYYNSEQYRSSLVELAQSVAEKYNADSNKISISGHSAGAITAYDLVREHPGVFSAIVPISGGQYIKDSDTSAFQGVSIWAFHGNKDPHTERAGYNNVINRTLTPLENAGVDTYLTTLEGEGHDIQGKIFNQEYKDEDGNMINPLEWAFQQTKS